MSEKPLGIIGGGQLGPDDGYLSLYMGHKVITLDPAAADCPSSRVSEVIVAPY